MSPAYFQGLRCLETSIDANPPEPEQANPDRPIPLSYDRLNYSTTTNSPSTSTAHIESSIPPYTQPSSLSHTQPSSLSHTQPSTTPHAKSGIPSATPPGRTSAVEQRSADNLPVSPVRGPRPEKSWQTSCKLSLYHKAVFAYYWLADCRAKAYKFGRALKCIHSALLCYSKSAVNFLSEVSCFLY